MTPLEDARNLGPVCARELAEIGIPSLEVLRALGWEEALVRWVGVYPHRAHASAARALIGAVQNEDYASLGPSDVAAARRMAAELRGERPQIDR